MHQCQAPGSVSALFPETAWLTTPGASSLIWLSWLVRQFRNPRFSTSPAWAFRRAQLDCASHVDAGALNPVPRARPANTELSEPSLHPYYRNLLRFHCLHLTLHKGPKRSLCSNVSKKSSTIIRFPKYIILQTIIFFQVYELLHRGQNSF